jgi:hypothetical protein
MLLPVGLLAGAGFYLSRNSIKNPLAVYHGPARLVVDKVEVVPATPLDIYKGFDTRIEIEGHVEGRSKLPPIVPPAQGGIGMDTENERFVLVDNRDSKVLRRIHPAESQLMMHVSGMEKIKLTLLLKAQNLSTTPQEVQLRGDVAFERSYFPGAKRGRIQVERLAAPIAVIVRQPGRKIPTPRPNRNPGVKLTDTRLESVSPTNSLYGEDSRIALELEQTTPRNSQHKYLSVIGTPYLQDAQGRKYSKFKFSNRSVSPPRPFTAPMNPSYSGGEDKSTIYLGVPLNQIPSKLRPLTLHMKVSVNQRWPLHVSTVVRP